MKYMLLGEFNAKLDSKGRVAFPSKYRKEMGDQLIITKGYEKALIIVSVSQWQTLLEGTERKPLIQAETREVQRFLLGGATDIDLDTKGRFLIPEYLRRFAQVNDEVVFLGISRYIEVWDKNRWNEHIKVLEDNIGRISEKLVPWEIKKKEITD
jgi:MraZ protein